jgi:predicted MarR family transcription regulator
MSPSDSLSEWWSFIVAGSSAAGAAAVSIIRVRDRVKVLEIRQRVIEDRGETLDETHDAVIRLEGRMTMLESDLRNSSEAFSKTMQANAASLDEINSTLTEITSEFKR